MHRPNFQDRVRYRLDTLRDYLYQAVTYHEGGQSHRRMSAQLIFMRLRSLQPAAWSMGVRLGERVKRARRSRDS